MQLRGDRPTSPSFQRKLESISTSVPARSRSEIKMDPSVRWDDEQATTPNLEARIAKR
jgi:hypothetical protein